MNNPTHITPEYIKENATPILIAGLGKPLSADLDVPGLWMKLTSQQNEIPNQIGAVAYGLCINMGNEKQSKYICGIQVSSVDYLPDKFSYKQLPAQTYAVFEHDGHVSTIRQTIDATNDWINQSDYKLAKNAAFFFERYGKDFNPKTGKGDIEIWFPLKLNKDQ